jgi:predicted dehydrogenase
MVRLGITGQVDSFHSNCICSIVNGVTHLPSQTAGIFEKMPELAGYQISCVYDPANRDAAMDVASAFSIPHIASSPEEMAEMVDGVMILCEKNVTDHGKMAGFFLERRLPVYVDKPFAATVADAEEIVNCARRYETPVLSCSARRFDPLIVGGTALLRKEAKELFSAYVLSEWRYDIMLWYGVHAVDVLFAVLGPDVVAVHEMGDFRHRMMKLTYRNGLIAVVDLPYEIGVGTSVVVFGKRDGHNSYWYLGTGRTPLFFAGLIERFGSMIHSRCPPIPYAEMVHVIRVLNAAEQSLTERKEIKVDIGETG